MSATDDVTNTRRKEAIQIVITNIKRLIADADLLIESGSQGSALSLAILAFEEGGKGHALEHGWTKPKKVRSHHEYRHVVALQVLVASMTQKHRLDMTELSLKIAEHHRGSGIQAGHSGPLPPMSDALRNALRAGLLDQFRAMGDSDFLTFRLEMKWLEKIGIKVQGGHVEKLRQSGLYVDVDDGVQITSSPMAIEPLEAQRWIWAATRVLNLLEHGAFDQSYTPLTDMIKGMGWTDLSMPEIAERVQELLKQ